MNEPKITESKITGPRLEPRREAHVLPWDGLTAGQPDVAQSVCELLSALAAVPYTRPSQESARDRSLPSIDQDRHNTTFLIHGKRGSGKTTVLITLLDLWARHVRGTLPPGGDGPQSFVSSPSPLVPLRVVDLQPLPDPTRLLLHVAESLHKLIDGIEAAGGPRGRTANARWDDPRPELSCRTAWKKFVAAAALGWDYDLSKRAGVDPDSYAEELAQATSRGFDATRSFRELLDTLVEEYSRWLPLGSAHAPQVPLFVLPIDDADMNPIRVVEVLQLVRSFRHPRLAYLLTGDIDLFRISARLRLRSLLRVDEGDAVWRRYGPALLTELTEQTLDKTIPPLHRRGISDLSDNRRLDEIRSVDLPDGPFRRVSWPRWLEQRGLGDALPSTMRGMRDFHGFLVDLARSPGAPKRKIADAAVEVWRRAVADERAISEADRDRLLSGVRVADTDSVRVYGVPVTLAFAERDRWDFPNSKLRVRTYHWWKLALSRTRAPGIVTGEDERLDLSDRTLLAFCLVTDLGADAIGELWEPPTAGNYPTAFASGLLTWDTSIEIRWPVPDWPSFADRSDFLWDWDPASAVGPNSPPDPDLVALHFLELNQALASSVSIKPEADNTADGLVARWKNVLSWLGELVSPVAAPQTPRERAVRAWAHDYVPLLGAPESGLSPDCARRILDATFAQDDRQHWNSHLVDRRRERISLAYSQYQSLVSRSDDRQVAEAIARLDVDHRDHPWFRPTEAAVTSALRVLASVRVGPNYTELFEPDEIRALEPLVRAPTVGAALVDELRSLSSVSDAADLILWRLKQDLERWSPGLSLPWVRVGAMVEVQNADLPVLAAGVTVWSDPARRLRVAEVSLRFGEPPLKTRVEGVVAAVAAGQRAAVRLTRLRQSELTPSEISVDPQPWPGAQVRTPGRRLSPWPFPSSLRIEVLEAIMHDWARLLGVVTKSQSLRSATTATPDILAANFVELVKWRSAHSDGRAPIRPEPDWGRILSHLRPVGESAGDAALSLWFAHLILLATPEAGLSPVAAEAILNARLSTPEPTDSAPRVTPGEASRLRRQWCAKLRFQPFTTEPEGHPWIVRVEQPGRE